MTEQKNDSKKKQNEREFVCFNLSGNTLKFARARQTNAGLQFADFAAIETQGMSDEDISKTAVEWLTKSGISPTETVILIPAHFAITKDIEIPSQDDKEIREILDLQTMRHTPYSQEEIVTDYLNIGRHKESYTKLIFAIVPLNLIRSQIAVLARANAKIERIVFGPEALGQACPDLFRLERKDVLRTFIHMESKFTDFMTTVGNKLCYIRSIPIGYQHFSAEKDRFAVRFVEEIRKSLEAREGEGAPDQPEEYILFGVLPEVESLRETLSQALSRPVAVIPYWDYLPLASEDLKNDLAQKKESFLDVASALLTLNNLKVNFIPQEIKMRKMFEQKSEDLVKIAISIVIILGMMCLWFAGRIYFKNAYLKNFKSRYEEDIKKADRLRRDFGRMEVVESFSKDINLPLEVLTELYRLIPPDVRFGAIKYGGEGKFSIEGNSRTMATVFTFITKLEESPYFEKVESKRTAKKKSGSEELVDFEIACMLQAQNKGKKK